MAYETMNQLMEHFRALAEEKNWIAAHDTLVYGMDCAHIPAKLELARLYKDCAFLGIPQQERYLKSELLFRSIMNLLNLPDRVMGTVSMEMAELYSYMNRPVGMLAMLLRAKRYGANVPEREVGHAKKLLENLDINEFGRSTRDAYDLATELSLAGGSLRLTELLLREASESGDQQIRGKASLELAEFYNARRSENHVYASEAARYYRQAAEAGFPECLSC